MDITEGAVVAIQKTAREAESNKDAVKILEGPNPRKRLLVVAGKPQEIDVPPAYREHAVYTLQDLVAYADREFERDQEHRMVLWHNEEGVALILDDADRRDRVALELAFSAAWEKLQKIADVGTAWLTQREFIRLLKNEFAVSEGTIVKFRKIDFRVMQSAQAQMERGRESLGKAIEAEAHSGGQELPEEIRVEVPIYVTAGEQERYSVRLLLDYDPQAAKIGLTVEADCLDRCCQSHQASIDSRLNENAGDVPVYYGRL